MSRTQLYYAKCDFLGCQHANQLAFTRHLLVFSLPHSLRVETNNIVLLALYKAVFTLSGRHCHLTGCEFDSNAGLFCVELAALNCL